MDATLLSEGRKPYSEAMRADGSADFRNNIQEKAGSVLLRTAVIVGACVCPVFKKLFNEVAVCSLQFYSVKACLDRIQSSLTKGTDDD